MQISTCSNCKNYLFDLKCLAFTNGIPDKILLQDDDHSKPLPTQDNDIVFEPIE